MNVPDGISEPLLPRLTRKSVEKGEIVVDVARDHVEVQTLRRRRLLIHELREALGARIGQPFLDGEPIALRLRNLLPLGVEEKLVVEALGRLAAQRAHDGAGQLDRIDEVLAGHLVIDA